VAQNGNPNAFQFAKPRIDDLNFSFSGLKTSILYTLQKEVARNADFVADHLHDICASVQRTIVDILLEKVERAVQNTGVESISLAGGVSANSELRHRFEQLGERLGVKTHIPKFEYCTDNGAMIGIAGYYKYVKSEFSSIELPAQARYKL
jgi:N6-L-threonylcarbamoyladenine synthase